MYQQRKRFDLRWRKLDTPRFRLKRGTNHRFTIATLNKRPHCTLLRWSEFTGLSEAKWPIPIRQYPGENLPASGCFEEFRRRLLMRHANRLGASFLQKTPGYSIRVIRGFGRTRS